MWTAPGVAIGEMSPSGANAKGAGATREAADAVAMPCCSSSRLSTASDSNSIPCACSALCCRSARSSSSSSAPSSDAALRDVASQ
eukprot:scaffold35770_cov101-Isochrysis_galbana.AAC.4